MERSAEEVHVHEALVRNGYPHHLLQSRRTRGPRGESERSEPVTTVTLPYVKGVSEAIRRILGRIDVRVAFKPPNSLRNILSHPKDPMPIEDKCNIVYRIPCKDCSSCYVGQTGRTFSQRLKEHQRAVKSFDVNASVLAEHVLNEDHRIAWEDASVLDQHPHLKSRLFMESWYIGSVPHTLNRERGPLSEQYSGLHV